MKPALRIVQIGLALSASTSIGVAQSQQGTPAPDLISKSTTAIGYQVDGGSTKVDLKSTGVSRQAFGEAKVEAKKGVTNIEAKVKGLAQPSTLGSELLTYVLWVVSSDGRASNLGEIQITNSGEGQLKATTQLQTFSLFVTAEPYFSVRQPNDVVVMENALRKDTKGRIFPIQEYKLMKRGQYQKLGNRLAPTLDLKNVPLEMYEARNAVDIARSHGAEKYAPEIFTKADGGLKLSENALARKANKKEIISKARSTVQSAEDARALAVQRQDEERITMEREAAAAKAKSEAEARAAAEAKRQAELAAAKQAQMKAEADAAAARAQAEAAALRAREEAATADAARAHHAAEQLRTQLLHQLNRILETKDTPRGLVVTMADVLFDTGKYDLRQPTREKLARLAGIILAHPGLSLEIEGHTDSTGSDEVNQTLSEQRASTVRGYLVDQGLSADTITSKGLGKAMPVADNGTVAGRQRNRRVEIVVSGQAIASKTER